MRAKDTLVRDTIRGIKTALTMEKTSSSGGGLDEKKELAVLQRLKKQRTEAAEIFREQGRLDLAEPEEAQLAVIMTYLPEMMEGDALKAALQVIVDQIQPAGPQDFGRVMG
ncbi:MAG: GatB/YqeY domain-containing protein, partial [Schleiferiaceae bacterium]|nr:GatB/YqeY domain-containing protein [Schleiferiaceae bacterium]